MGYRWHNGRLMSDKEYHEEQGILVIFVFLVTPALLIGWLVGTFFGATAGIWMGIAVAAISWFVLPIVILISGVVWALAAIWIVLWANDLDRNVYHFFGKKTESIIGTVELYKSGTVNDKYFEKILYHKVFDYKYETDAESAKDKLRSTYRDCMNGIWSEAVKFGRMYGFNVTGSPINSPLRRSDSAISARKRNYEYISSYSRRPFPKNVAIVISCDHETATPKHIKKILSKRV